jgi:hypothetical protein
VSDMAYALPEERACRWEPTSAYVSIRQHTSAYVSICQPTYALPELKERLCRWGHHSRCPRSCAMPHVHVCDDVAESETAREHERERVRERERESERKGGREVGR